MQASCEDPRTILGAFSWSWFSILREFARPTAGSWLWSRGNWKTLGDGHGPRCCNLQKLYNSVQLRYHLRLSRYRYNIIYHISFWMDQFNFCQQHQTVKCAHICICISITFESRARWCMEIKRKLGANNSMVCPRNLASRTQFRGSFPKKLFISEDSEACGCDTSSSNAFHSTGWWACTGYKLAAKFRQPTAARSAGPAQISIESQRRSDSERFGRIHSGRMRWWWAVDALMTRVYKRLQRQDLAGFVVGPATASHCIAAKMRSSPH